MPFLGNTFGWPHLVVILVVLLLLFGATRLPALSKGLAQSMKIFRSEFKGDASQKSDAESSAAAPSVAPTATLNSPASTAPIADAEHAPKSDRTAS